MNTTIYRDKNIANLFIYINTLDYFFKNIEYNLFRKLIDSIINE